MRRRCFSVLYRFVSVVSYCCCAGCVCRVSLFFLSRIPTKDDVAPKYRLWRICAFKITAQDVLRRKYACRSRSLWPAAPAISTLSLMCSFCFLSASGCQVRILPLLPPPQRAWVQPQQHVLSTAVTAVPCFLCSESRIFCRELGSHKGHNSESEPL